MPELAKRFYDEAKETMPLEERKKYLEEKLRWIIPYAYENAPAIKEKMDRAGVKPSEVRTYKDLERIPITRKQDLIELQQSRLPFGGFLATPEEDVKDIYVHPGPCYSPSGHMSQWVKGLAAMGLGSKDIGTMTFSYHWTQGGLVIADAAKALGVTIIPTGPGNSELQLRTMRDLKATVYMGTLAFLMSLIKKAEELGYNFHRDFMIRKAWISAEVVTPSTRKALEEEYSIEIYENYGNAELAQVGYECEYHSGLHIAEEVILETVDPATGKQLGQNEEGEIVGTLVDESYPLVRFGTGDLSLYTEEPCPCGRSSSRLVQIVGRAEEGVKVRSLFLRPKEVEEVILQFPEFSKFQIVVSRSGLKDEVTLKIEAEPGIREEHLSEKLQHNLQAICRLRFDKIEFLDKGTLPPDQKKLVDLRVWERKS